MVIFRSPSAVSFLLALVFGMATGQESTDCTALDVERTDSSSVSGNDLGVCETPESQCCTQDYLDSVRRDVGKALLDAMRDQLDQFDIVGELVETLGSYFEVDLINSIKANVPLAVFYQNDVPLIIAALANLLSRARFNINSTNPEVNTTQLVVDIVTGLKMLIQGSSSFNSDQKMCLVNEIDTNINQTAIRMLGGSLKDLRRANSAMIRISYFLKNFTRDLAGFDVSYFPSLCITEAINLGFCGRCKKLLPPLCSNTCGSLVRGCYAAFFSGLQGEFNNLWIVIRQIITLIEVGVKNTEERENALFDDSKLSSIVIKCGLAQALGRKKRKADFMTPPAALMTRASELKDVFAYGLLGPEFCKLASSERDFCQSGTGIGSSERRCEPNKVCTSSCQCWTGTETSAVDTTVFKRDDISEQGKNPVFHGTPEEYEEVAKKLGTPIDDFLTSGDFFDVLPQNLVLPKPKPYSAGQRHAIISFSLLLVGAMVLVFVF